jgi:predicted membrane protein
MKTKNWRVFLPLLLLLLPLVGMLISDEVNWSFSDFLIMGLLILSLSFGIKEILRATLTYKYKALFIALFLLVFMLIWVELAVGIFGYPIAGN